MARKPLVVGFVNQIKFLNPEKPVRVYRNLHTGLFSVLQGTVKFHTDVIYLKDVKFLVNERGRQNVIRNKRKEVHAYVYGYICDAQTYFESCNDSWFANADVSYNPYKAGHFMAGDKPCRIAITCQLMKIMGRMQVKARGLKFWNIPLAADEVGGILRETVHTHLL